MLVDVVTYPDERMTVLLGTVSREATLKLLFGSVCTLSYICPIVNTSSERSVEVHIY